MAIVGAPVIHLGNRAMWHMLVDARPCNRTLRLSFDGSNHPSPFLLPPWAIRSLNLPCPFCRVFLPSLVPSPFLTTCLPFLVHATTTTTIFIVPSHAIHSNTTIQTSCHLPSIPPPSAKPCHPHQHHHPNLMPSPPSITPPPTLAGPSLLHTPTVAPLRRLSLPLGVGGTGTGGGGVWGVSATWVIRSDRRGVAQHRTREPATWYVAQIGTHDDEAVPPPIHAMQEGQEHQEMGPLEVERLTRNTRTRAGDRPRSRRKEQTKTKRCTQIRKRVHQTAGEGEARREGIEPSNMRHERTRKNDAKKKKTKKKREPGGKTLAACMDVERRHDRGKEARTMRERMERDEGQERQTGWTCVTDAKKPRGPR